MTSLHLRHGTAHNYGYTLRRAFRRSSGRALFAEHVASLHFSAAPGHGVILDDYYTPCRDVLDQIRPFGRTSYILTRYAQSASL